MIGVQKITVSPEDVEYLMSCSTASGVKSGRGEGMSKLVQDARIHMLKAFKDPIPEVFKIQAEYEAKLDEYHSLVNTLLTKTEQQAAELERLRDDLSNCQAALAYYKDGDAAADLAEAVKQLRACDLEMERLRTELDGVWKSLLHSDIACQKLVGERDALLAWARQGYTMLDGVACNIDQSWLYDMVSEWMKSAPSPVTGQHTTG